MISVQRVFISYASEDRQWAKEMARILRGQRVQVFVDFDSIRAGSRWPSTLLDELEAADQIRLGWSRDAAQSDWVRREYTEALKKPPVRNATGANALCTPRTAITDRITNSATKNIATTLYWRFR